ncbi:TniQ family protein [Streptomyces sp. NPDC092903]|uniref:TniQ family protein n=1 Tax=Streptomyces sp. NPDC092903 TaxID=3366017 RepID=UPI0037FC4E26
MSPEPTRPLARSLDPLFGESLSGFLLRLSYRLGLAPHRVATLCGLACRSDVIPHDQLRGLGPEATERLARATRLSVPEAQGLTLESFNDRYPPLARLQTSTKQAPGRLSLAWAVNPDTRYCPRCLTGEDTPVQQAYGGAWQLRWHLPVTFACAQHRCLLEQTCPQCAQPLSGRVTTRYSLLTLPHVPDLHPAACRNQNPAVARRHHARATACGARLDQLTPPATPLAQQDLDRILLLQRQLDRLLSPSPFAHSDDHKDAAAYFGDLILAARLVMMSWPAGAGLLPSTSLADLVAEYAAGFAPPDASTNSGTRRHAPRSTAQSAALLLAAATALGDRDMTSMRDRLEPLAREVYRRSRSTGTKLFTNSDTSPTLLRATAPLPYGAQRRTELRVTPRPYMYRLEEIPPLFPRQWYADLLEPLTAQLTSVTTVVARHMRWAGSLRLAELITGHTWRDCGPVLGIPPASAVQTMHVLGRRMTDAGLWPAFETAIDEAASRLHDQEHRVDYARRRLRTTHWRLTRDQYQLLCEDIPGLEQRGATGDTCVGEVLLWSMINESSYLHSPAVLHRRWDSPQPDRITCKAGEVLRGGRPSLILLLRRLETYADRLADQCDRGALPTGNAPAAAQRRVAIR